MAENEPTEREPIQRADTNLTPMTWETWGWAVAGKAAHIAQQPVEQVRSGMARNTDRLEAMFRLNMTAMDAAAEMAWTLYARFERK